MISGWCSAVLTIPGPERFIVGASFLVLARLLSSLGHAPPGRECVL